MAAMHWARRDPQPTTWNTVHEERHGVGSGENVEILIARKEYKGKASMNYNPSKRKIFDNTQALAEARRVGTGMNEASSREPMIFMQRGTHAACVGNGFGLNESMYRDMKSCSRDDHRTP